MTNQAQQIAHLLNNDGQSWETDDGRHFRDVVDTCLASEHTSGGLTRHEMADGSAIVSGVCAWSLGHPTTEDDDRSRCVCWADVCEVDRCADECECGCHSADYTDTAIEQGVIEFVAQGKRYQYRYVGLGVWSRFKWDADFGGGCYIHTGVVSAPQDATPRQLAEAR